MAEKQKTNKRRPTKLDPYIETLLKDPRFLKAVDDILTRPACSFKTLGEVQKLITHKVEPKQFTENALNLIEELSEMDGQTKEGLEKMMFRITNDYVSYATIYLFSGVLIGVMFSSDEAS